MSKIENILCVIDPTASSQPALGRAAWLATKTGAKLEVLICYYNEFLSGRGLFEPDAVKQAREEVDKNHAEQLDKFVAPHLEAGLDIKTTRVWDHPLFAGVVRYASSSGADIVLKDTHHHPGLNLAALTNTDWSLIRTCPLPLWLVKPHDISEPPQLIAAIDPVHEHDKPAELDNNIIDMSKIIAEAAGGDVHAFHAFGAVELFASPMTEFEAAAYAPPSDVEDAARAQHQSQFEEVTKDHGIAEDRAHFVTGNTHEVLPLLAKKLDAALVVMGAVARNRLQRIFIGSTAERTMDRLPCDLLVVKPSWFKTPINLEANSPE